MQRRGQPGAKLDLRGDRATDGRVWNYAPSTTTAASAAAQLPIVGLDVIKRFFPEISTQQEDGKNETAAGNPQMTRMIIHANSDGTRRVTRVVGPVCECQRRWFGLPAGRGQKPVRTLK